MINILLFFYIIILSTLSYLFIKLIFQRKMNNDLAFFVICNYILSFTFLVFFFYFKDVLFSLVDIFFLLLNTIFICYELKNIYSKYNLLSIPYLIYIVFVFFILFDLFLMNL